MSKKLYVAGGEFQDLAKRQKEFKPFELVRPTGGRPYVTDQPSGTMRRMTMHHSHFYVLSADLTTATLYAHGEPSTEDVRAPQTVQLTPEQQEGIKTRIVLNEIYS